MTRSERLTAALTAALEKVSAMELQDEADAVVSLDEEAADAVGAGVVLGKLMAEASATWRPGCSPQAFYGSADGVHYFFVAKDEDEAISRVELFVMDLEKVG